MDVKLLKNKVKFNDTNLDEIVNKIYQEIKSDHELLAYLKKMGITNDIDIKNNVGIISCIKDDMDYCRHCPGFYRCEKAHPHYVFKLVNKNQIFDKAMMPCDLKIKDDLLNQYYLVRDFPAEWRESNVIDLDKSKVRMKLIKRYLEIMNDKRNWIFITGSHRSGKSYLAATFINDLIKNYQGKSIFLNYPERVRELQNYTYVNKEDFARLMNLYMSVDYLVLDDFGNEYKSDYIRDSITLAILNERARKGLVTIFTSEFNIDEIANMYSLNAAGKARGRQLKNLLLTYAVEEIDISTANIY